MAEFGIHPYYQATAAKADLVLVHGLMGNSAGTWAGKDDQGQPTYWPDWVKEQRPNVNIWLADYDSSLIAWLQPTMPLDQIAGSLLMHAQDQGLGTRPIHWVGHSMGGLVIKHLLCQARLNTNPDWKAIAAASSAVTFLGTPHHGAGLANWKDYFTNFLNAADLLFEGGFWGSAGRLFMRVKEALDGEKRQSHIDQLAAHNRDLGKLNDDFSHWLQAARDGGSLVRARNYFETRPVRGMVTVVPNASAKLSNALVQEAGVPADHFGICKFSSAEGNFVFDGLLSTLDDLCKRAPAVEDAAPAMRADLLDRAWRKALAECSTKVRVLVCKEMKSAIDIQPDASADLEDALARAYQRSAPAEMLGIIRYVLGYPDAGFSGLSPDECRQRSALYVLLLARAVALWRQADLRRQAMGGTVVPHSDDSNRLAIAVVAHLVSGQGLLLKIEPGAVQADNLLELAALVDASAHLPGKPSGLSPLEIEVRAWLRRVVKTPHSPQSSASLKAYLDRFEEGHYARPILLDRENALLDESINLLVHEVGIGVIGVAAHERPATIAQEDWQTLCDAFDLKGFDLTGEVPAKPTPPEPSPQAAHAGQPSPSMSPVQVIISGPVGQSNVTTGTGSPIHAQHAGTAQAPASHDALALAVFGFETALNGHAALTNDLRELHGLVQRRDASPSALSLLPRLLRPLREAAQESSVAADAWARLRHAAREHWPDCSSFL